jgi:hypothetical protein
LVYSHSSLVYLWPESSDADIRNLLGQLDMFE